MPLTRRDMLKTSLGIAATSLFADSVWAIPSKRDVKPQSLPKIPEYHEDYEPIWQKLQEEKYKIYEKWKEYIPPHWRHFQPDEMWAIEGACLLENQRLINECTVDIHNKHYLLILKHLWSQRKIDISFQSMLAPCQMGFWRDPKTHELKARPFVAKTKKLMLTFAYEAIQDLQVVHGLDATAELMAMMGAEFDLELQRMILQDIRLAARKVVINNSRPVDDAIVLQAAYIRRKLNPKIEFNKWAVVSEDVWRNIEPDWLNGNIFQMMGQIKDPIDGGYIEVFGDRLLPDKTAIVGCNKGLYTGYICLPYIPLVALPIHLEPDTFVPRRQFLMRFDSKLVNPNYFAVLHF